MAWETLLSIAEENRADAQATQVVSCPNDGTPLDTGPGGILYCPFDGWSPRA